ncbi:MAG: hypothetical protein ACK4RS_05130 [Thiothrix sp.]
MQSDTAYSTINPTDLRHYVNNQDDVYKGLLSLAALPNDPQTPAEWKQFMMAGVQYANQQCDNYLHKTQQGDAALTARSVVNDLQRQYLEKISANQYTNRPAAFSALQGYIALCSPGNIALASRANARVLQPNVAQSGGINITPYVSIAR